MPRTREQNRRIRKQRMEQILQAALQVYREKGYHGSEMGEIARRAQLGRGLVYYYFKDKEDVFISLIVRSLSEWKDRMDSILQSERSVPDKLAAILTRMCESALDHPDITYFHQTIACDVHLLFPHRKQEIAGYYEEAIWRPLRQLFEEGSANGQLQVSPSVAERYYISMLFGAIHGESMIDRASIPEWVEVACYGIIRKNEQVPTGK
ncbi:hypothetical protein CEN49_25705 [Fischerella thermalis CCMEE 5273]|nr:hypothetical protein CEN49_25705 [Fischerella thermalis CCMEE 5273]